MDALQNLIQGFAFSFDVNCYLMAALGTLLGIVIGALPGLTATTGVTIFLPMTFYMQPVPAFGFLCGIYCGGNLCARILIRNICSARLGCSRALYR